jgi:hypothetical protein
MKSKIKIAGLTIIIIAVVFGLIAPNVSYALNIFNGLIEPFAASIFRILGWIITKIASLILTLSAAIFSAMLKEGFRSYKSAAQGAWTATRDIANMFFILFMIVVAFGTILRNEKYGAKKLLPKIIITALLINFSAVFCYVVIDLTNVAANAFLNMAKNEIRALNQQSDPDIGAAIVDSLKLTGTLMPMDCVKTFDQDFGNCQFLPQGSEEKAKCVENATKNKNDCEGWNKKIAQTKNEEEGMGDVIVAAIMSSVIMLVAAVTLFMSGLVMLLRTVFIWVLVALAPLAIACSLLPTLRPNWEKWLKKFLNWCLFAPVFTFFIWLVVKIGTSNQIGAISSSVGNRTNLATSGAITEFFTGSSTLIRYCIVLATLIIGLIASKELGVVGGDMAFNALNKMGKGAAGWAKKRAGRLAGRPLEAGGRLAGAGALGRLAGTKLFKGTKLGGRMEAKALQMRQSMAQTKENKEYEKLTSTMTDDQLLKEVKTAGKARKLIATQKAQTRGLLQKTEDRDAVRSGINTLRGYGFEKEAGELEEARFSVIGNSTRQEEVWKKARSKGTHKNLRSAAVKNQVDATGNIIDASGTAAIKTMVKCAINVTDALAMIKELPLLVQEQIKNTMEQDSSAFLKNNRFDPDNIKERSVYAAVTGKVDVAFRNSLGVLNNPELGKFVRNMKPTDFANVDESSIQHIARHVDASAASTAGRYLSAEQRRDFARVFNTMPKSFRDTLRRSPDWASFIV